MALVASGQRPRPRDGAVLHLEFTFRRNTLPALLLRFLLSSLLIALFFNSSANGDPRAAPACCGGSGWQPGYDDSLVAGETLKANSHCLCDPSITFQLTMMSNGNLQLTRIATNKILWTSGTAGNKGAYATVTSSGMFAVMASNNTPIWIAPNTAGNPGAALYLLTTGNAVVGIGYMRPHLWSTQIINERPSKPSMVSGETLRQGYYLRSKNGYYWLQINSNGALQLYVYDQARGSRVYIWETPPPYTANSTAVFKQGVLSVRSPSGQLTWSSSPNPTAGNVLQIQDTGNLVIFNRSNPSVFIWQTYTTNLKNAQLLVNNGDKSKLKAGQQLVSGNGFYRLVMGSQGNAVVYYAPTSTPIWQTGTYGNPGAYLYFQPDSNLAVISSTGAILWQSYTSDTDGFELVIMNDGNLAIYSKNYQCVWQIGGVVNANNRLAVGQPLRPGRYLQSSNGQYRLFLSPTTGTLWLYQLTPNPVNPLWTAPPTTQQLIGDAIYYYLHGAPNSTLVLSKQGQLALVAPNKTIIWTAGTAGPTGNYTFSLTNAGNLVISSPQGQPTWQSYSNIWRGASMVGGSVLNPGQMLQTPDRQYQLNLTLTCNLVIYRMDGSITWQSNTALDAGTPCQLMMNSDGALNLYAGSENQYGLWSSGTGGNPNAIAVLQEGGYVEIWASNQLTLLASIPSVSNFVLREENRALTQAAGFTIKTMIKTLLG